MRTDHCSVGRPNDSLPRIGRSTERGGVGRSPDMGKRISVVAYGAIAYLGFIAVFVYMIGFLANAVVPKSVDDGTAGPAWVAVVIDAALLGIFAVQHSVMARPWFKRWWTARL